MVFPSTLRGPRTPGGLTVCALLCLGVALGGATMIWLPEARDDLALAVIVVALLLGAAALRDLVSARRQARAANLEARDSLIACARELHRHQAQALEDLGRLRALLVDTAGRIGGSVASLGQLCDTDRDVARVEGEGGTIETVHRELGSLVVAMQFEDIARQMIEHAEARLAQAGGLTRGLTALEALRCPGHPDMPIGPAPCPTCLRERAQVLLEQAAAIERRNPVRHADLAPGECDLFDTPSQGDRGVPERKPT